MNSLEELDREDLLFFIGCYNNYVVEFYDDHEEGMYPVSAYEFFDNEFQEILNQDEEKLYDNIFSNPPTEFKYFGGSTFIYKGLFVELRKETIKTYEDYIFQMDFAIFETEKDLNTDYEMNIGVGYYKMQSYEKYWNYVKDFCDNILKRQK